MHVCLCAAIAMKPHDEIWKHFLPLDANGEVLVDHKLFKTAKKAQCRLCDWSKLPNTTRMKEHFKKHDHDYEAEEQSEAAVPAPKACTSCKTSVYICCHSQEPESSPNKRQIRLEDYLDRKFNADEQYRAEMAQAFATVMSGHSHNHLAQQWTLDFISSLRADYKPLTPKTIGARIPPPPPPYSTPPHR